MELGYGQRRIKHGDARRGHTTKEYAVWDSIKNRCHNPNCSAFKEYGGSGIIVCDRWRYSFENFLADMGRAPSNEHSIDRFPDQKGGYNPENCRWATKKEQARNRKTNVFVEFNGEKMCLVDFAKKIGVHKNTISFHLKKGRSVSDIVAFTKMGNEKYGPKAKGLHLVFMN